MTCAGKDPTAEFRPSRRRLLQLGGLLGVALVAPGAAYAIPAASLSASDLALIGEVAELIIPATDTGGAKQAGVPAFVDLMVTRWFHPDERRNFMAGMAEFAKGAGVKYGKPFAALTQKQKTEYFGELLRQAESAPPAAVADLPNVPADNDASPSPPVPFVVLMKRLTLFGYYTSELGGSVELSLNLVPNEYLPDAPWRHGERADSDATIAFPAFSAR